MNARSFRADWRAWWRELEDQQELRRHLDRLASHPALPPSAALLREPVDVVVTTNEMNDRHGTGVLVKRVFEGRRGLFSIRARNDYGGEHDFGDAAVVVAHGRGGRPLAFGRVLDAMRGRTAARVVCVPYAADDLLTSIALAEIFQAPLCAWIMDDYNVGTGGIPDALMKEFLSKCTLRLATHSELREAYERKYRLPFSILPAVVTESFVTTEVAPPDGPEVAAGTGALVGSFWSQRWFDRMCELLGASGHATHWFGNHRSPYFRFPPERLAAARLEARGIVPEAELAPLLRRYPYAVVPTGTLDEHDDASHTALLSLPGRILFAAATAHVPQIVVGSPETSAARVVTRLGIGVVSPFDPDAYRRAVAHVLEPEVQLRMRRNAAAVAPALSSRGVGEWLYASIERGAPADERFERVFPRLSPAPSPVPERA